MVKVNVYSSLFNMDRLTFCKPGILIFAFAENNYLIRKVMIKLDSIVKSRDITLPTKVHLVKAMVFPVVMYGCESWPVKKAEH